MLFAANDSQYRVLAFIDETNVEVIACGDVYFPINKGVPILLDGEWINHKTYGKQFKIQSATIQPIESDTMFVALLSASVTGIGPALARRIIKHFDTLDALYDVLEFDEQKLLQVNGIRQSMVDDAHEWWMSQKHNNKTLKTLMEYGLTLFQARKAMFTWKSNAIAIVDDNPYALTEISGIGFKIADKIAGQRGIVLADPRRLRAGVLFVLEEQENFGNCYLPSDKLTSEAMKVLGVWVVVNRW